MTAGTVQLYAWACACGAGDSDLTEAEAGQQVAQHGEGGHEVMADIFPWPDEGEGL